MNNILKCFDSGGCNVTSNKYLALIKLFLTSLCLMTRVISVVESFTVPSASTTATACTENLHLAQTDIREKYSSSATDDNNKNYWKVTASYVFDTSVDTISDNKGENGNKVKEKDQIHPHSKPIVLFDGVCNLCNDAANFVIDHDATGKFRFASLQSNVAKGLLIREGKDPIETADVVLVTSTKAYYSSEAVAKIMTELDLPKLQIVGRIGQISPSFMREAIYKVVSGSRFAFGKKDSCRLDFDGDFTSRFVSDPPVLVRTSKPKDDDT